MHQDGSPALVVLAFVATYLVHSSALLLLAWASAARLRAPGFERVRQTLWRTAALGGLATAAIQIGLDVEPLGGRVALERALATPAPAPRASARGAAPRTHAAPARPDRAPSAGPSTAPAIAVRQSTPALAAERPAPERRARRPWRSPAAWLAAWAAAAMLALALGRARVRTFIGPRTRLTGGSLPALLDELCRHAGIRRAPRLFHAPRLCAPVTAGLLRPAIYLPSAALAPATLGLAEQRALLAHELAHVARRDPLWLFGLHALACAFPLHPLLGRARAELHDLAELLADEWALERTHERVALARCLTEVAAWILGERRAPVLAGMAARGSGLARRVERILASTPRRRGLGARPSAALALLALGALTLAAPGAKSSGLRVETRAPGVAAHGPSAPPPAEEPRATRSPEARLAARAARTPAPPAPSARRTAPGGDAVQLLLEQLERETAALEAELALLRREVAQGDLELALARPLEELERRLGAQRGRGERLRALLPQVQAALADERPAANPLDPSDDPETQR